MKKQIVFYMGVAPYVMIYKIAKEFKKRGYETVLCTMSEKEDFDINSYKDAFDKILCSNFKFENKGMKNLHYLLKRGPGLIKFIAQLKRLRPYAWFGIGRTNWQIKFAHKYFFKRFPFIFFEYDLDSHFFSSRSEARAFGRKDFEIDSEKYCFENCEGLLHKGDPHELECINGRIFDKVKLPELKINFLPYCSDEFIVPINKNKLSKKDGEIHVVFIGGQFSDPPSTKMQNETFQEMFDNKIHVHMYTRLQHYSKEKSRDFAKEQFKEFIGNPYFHIHDALEPKEIISEISKYDLGIWFAGECYKRKGLEQKYSIGNKISSYFEAGIPFVYQQELIYSDKLLKKYGLKLDFNKTNIVKKIKKASKNYPELQKKVIKARKDFNLNKHFLRLEKFVEKVVFDKLRTKNKNPNHSKLWGIFNTPTGKLLSHQDAEYSYPVRENKIVLK